ncbi:hypothetical protein ACERK3_00190 [Phycisphaerales bacterium AB-hyl4]|uniref:PH domain-containing protein n=1 Tax=Natronomicrosphaera hydrolytica TaxID=3242702 RepID=A0ABV4U1J4_9BACT
MPYAIADADATQTIDLHDGGARFVLPTRQLGVFRWLGVALVGGALLFGLIPLGFIITMVRDGEAFYFLIVPLLILLPIALPIALGLFLFAGHSEVEVNRTQMIYTERCGALRKRWRRPLQDITSLRVVGLDDPALQSQSIRPASSGQLPSALSHLSALVVRTDNQKPMHVGIGYSRALLEPLAAAVSERAATFVGSPLRIETGDDADNLAFGHDGQRNRPLTLDDLPAPPAKATALLERNDVGLTILVPPAGLRGAKGLFGFSLLWCGFMVVFTGLTLSGELDLGQTEVWAFAAFALGFWAIGIGMFVFALNMAKRKAIIDIIGDTLVISRQSLFGTKQHEWTADQLRDIVVGPSGMEVNKRPIMNLQIIPHEGKTLGLFSERADDELEWIAKALKLGLQIGRN